MSSFGCLSSRGKEIFSSQGGFYPAAASNRYDAITNPDGVISFAMAENWLVQDELTAYINSDKTKIPPGAFTYGFITAGGTRFMTAMAAHFNKYFHPFVPVETSEIIGMNGVTAVDETLGFALADPGDAFIVTRPIYGRFEVHFAVRAGVKTVYANMNGVDPLGVEAVDRYESAVLDAEKQGVKVRALMISNPHNPLGRCYSPESLGALLRFCSKHDIHLISDEIYALSVYESSEPGAVPFTSILSFDLTGIIDPKLVHVLYGFSKDFGAAGFRLGCLQSRNEELLGACRPMSRFHGVSGLSTTVASIILQDEDFLSSFLSLSRTRLAESFHTTIRALNDMGVEYHRGVNAGLFIYVDLRPFLPNDPSLSAAEKEHALSQRLLHKGVFLSPGEERSEDSGWFRIVFALRKEDLVEGLKRLGGALREKEGE